MMDSKRWAWSCKQGPGQESEGDSLWQWGITSCESVKDYIQERSQASTKSLSELIFIFKSPPLGCRTPRGSIRIIFHVSATPTSTDKNVNSAPSILVTVALDPTGYSEMKGGSSYGGSWKETLRLPHEPQWPLLAGLVLHAILSSANPRELTETIFS